MPPGLLTLRKLQLRALRARTANKGTAQLVRELEHEIIRLHQRLYNAETYDDMMATFSADPHMHVSALRADVEKALSEPELKCLRCLNQVRGFRSPQHRAVYYMLGLCQLCQDLGDKRDTTS